MFSQTGKGLMPDSQQPRSRGPATERSSFLRTHSLAAFAQREDGQDLVEYAMIVALMGLGLVVTLSSIRNDIGNEFSRLESYM